MKLLILLLSLSLNIFAFFPDLDVQSIAGKYMDGKGSAFAQSATYDLEVVKISHKNIEVNFNIISKNLVLNDKNTTVKLKYDFSFLNVLKALDFDDLNIESKAKKFHATAPLINLFVEDDQLEVSQVDITSDLEGLSVNTDGDIDIFSGILINGDLSVKKMRLRTPKIDNFFEEIIKDNPEIISDQKNLGKRPKLPAILRNLRLVVKESTFSGSVYLDSWLNAWLNIGGQIENDTKSNIVKIRLLKAKLGVFSIRKMLLKKIRKAQIKGISVDGDIISIDSNSVFLQ